MDRYADNTDTYAFRSTEPGRERFVTLMANFIPFQEPSGGPQFYRWDDTVLYEIKVDNTGDGVEDITYQFRFTTETVNGDTVLGHAAVNQNGVINNLHDPDYNMPQIYTVTRIRDRKKKGEVIASGLRTPPNNVGPNTTPNYEASLGSKAVYRIPSNNGRVFAGQRDEYFYIDLGGVFDRLALRAITQDTDSNFENGGIDTTQGYNISLPRAEPLSAFSLVLFVQAIDPRRCPTQSLPRKVSRLSLAPEIALPVSERQWVASSLNLARGFTTDTTGSSAGKS